MSKIADMLKCWSDTGSPAEVVGRFKNLGDLDSIHQSLSDMADEEQAYADLAALSGALEGWAGSLAREKKEILNLLETSEKSATACMAYNGSKSK